MPSELVHQRGVTTESRPVKWLLIGIALAFLGFFLFLPLVAVFVEALRNGLAMYWSAITEPDAVAAMKLTLTVAAIAVPLNLVFGVAAAWAIAKFEFRGKSLLITFIDLPFSVSPVIAGFVFILLFGAQSYFLPVTQSLGLQIVLSLIHI